MNAIFFKTVNWPKQCFCFILLLIVLQANSQSVITTNVKLPKHPRLLLFAGEEKNINLLLQKDKRWRQIHQTIESEGMKMLQFPLLERKQIGRRLLSVSREALRRIFYMAYLHRVTGDKKILDRCKKELLNVCKFSDWNPSHFLDVAEMTTAVAIGYDWLYDQLSRTERKIIEAAIWEKGIEPSKNKKHNWFLRATNNWNQVCNAGMVYGALAVYEKHPKEAIAIINRSIQSLPKAMGQYAPDGGYPEGYGYWDYGTSFNVLLISALQKAVGTDFGLKQQPGFMKTADYFQQMVGPTGRIFSYSDVNQKEGGLAPASFWFAKENKQPWLLFNIKRDLDRGIEGLENIRLLPAALIFGSDISFDNVSSPPSLYWVGKGVNPIAIMRTSWVDTNAIYLCLKAGSPSVSHGHMDIGSFVLDAMGERWAMDFGMQNYESLESKGVKIWNGGQYDDRWRVFRYNNYAHSTLTVNDSLQRVKGYATITAFENNPNCVSAATDMSSVYQGQLTSANRRVGILDGSKVVILDTLVNTNKNATIRWAMLTPAKIISINNREIVLEQNQKKMGMRINCSTPVKAASWSTTPPQNYDAPNPGTVLVGFTLQASPNEKITIKVILEPT
ncbi:MAG: heparinase II/III family protein [Niabella sp.]